MCAQLLIILQLFYLIIIQSYQDIIQPNIANHENYIEFLP
jgi:hypothetical protein